MQEKKYETDILRLTELAYVNAKEHGWWPKHTEKPFSETIALIHTEASEAYEEYRNNHGVREIYFGDNGKKPEGIPIELADIIIRIFDFCGRYDINIAHALYLKMKYNETRPYRHGGKLA